MLKKIKELTGSANNQKSPQHITPVVVNPG